MPDPAVSARPRRGAWRRALPAVAAAAAALLLAATERGVRVARAHLFLPTDGARWIWAPAEWARGGSGELAFLAASDFTLDEVPAAASLLALADEEYLLYLNGRLLATGRYRQGAPFDALRVEPWLRPGRNRLAVELRSARGAGGFVLRLTGAGGEPLAETGEDWRIFRGLTPGLVQGWRPLEEGAAPLVWGLLPTGRWSVPEVPGVWRRPDPRQDSASPAVPVRVRSGDPVGEWRVWRPSSPPSAASSAASTGSLGAWALFDWGEDTAGYLRLSFARGAATAAGARALVLTGTTPPDPLKDAACVAVPLAGATLWRDTLPRSLRYALVLSDADLAGAEILPAAVPGVAEESRAGVLGIRAPPLRTPVEQALRQRLEDLLADLQGVW
jgi:hypothetical protein